MSKKAITTKEAQLKLDSRYPNKYTIMSEYTGRNDNIEIRHNECNGVFKTTYHSIYSGNQICPCCKMKRFLNAHGYSLNGYKEKFKSDPRSKDYEILDLYYKGTEAFLKILHKTCRQIFDMRVQCFINNKQNCSYCKPKITGIKNRKHVDTFKNEVGKLVSTEYSVIGEYINNKTKIEFVHNKCNIHFFMTPNQFLHGNRCPGCRYEAFAQKRRKSAEAFKEEIERSGYFKLLSIYKNDRSLVRVFSVLDNETYDIKASELLQRVRKGKFKKYTYLNETLIYNLLNSNSNVTNIKKQVDMDIFTHNLKFDFSFNIGLQTIYLEYDGEFHYKPIFSKKSLQKQRQNDKLKNKYCLENNMILYRIPYWEKKNIEKIVQSIIDNTDYNKKFLVETIYNVQRLDKAYFTKNMPVESSDLK